MHNKKTGRNKVMRNIIVVSIFLLVLLVSATVLAEYSTPMYYLVTDSYMELENAKTRHEELQKMGYDAKIMNVPIDGVEWWRIVVGEDPQKENLLTLQKKLESDNISFFYAYDSKNEPAKEIYYPEPAVEEEKEVPSIDAIREVIKEKFKTFDDFLIWLWWTLRHC